MFNFVSRGKKSINKMINDKIDAGCLAKHKLEPQRKYLGISFIGGWCERQTQYKYMAQLGLVKKEEFEPKTLRIFKRGHIFEDVVCEWLQDAGFILHPNDPKTGKQFEISLAEGNLLGHCDGVIKGFRFKNYIPLEYPIVWENKALGARSFNAIKKNGVKKEKIEYYNQMQCYMAGLNCSKALFTSINMDSMELIHEIIPYNEQQAMAMSVRAINILKNVENKILSPRGTKKQDYFKCKWCDFNDICWD